MTHSLASTGDEAELSAAPLSPFLAFSFGRVAWLSLGMAAILLLSWALSPPLRSYSFETLWLLCPQGQRAALISALADRDDAAGEGAFIRAICEGEAHRLQALEALEAKANAARRSEIFASILRRAVEQLKGSIPDSALADRQSLMHTALRGLVFCAPTSIPQLTQVAASQPALTPAMFLFARERLESVEALFGNPELRLAFLRSYRDDLKRVTATNGEESELRPLFRFFKRARDAEKKYLLEIADLEGSSLGEGLKVLLDSFSREPETWPRLEAAMKACIGQKARRDEAAEAFERLKLFREQGATLALEALDKGLARSLSSKVIYEVAEACLPNQFEDIDLWLRCYDQPIYIAGLGALRAHPSPPRAIVERLIRGLIYAPVRLLPLVMDTIRSLQIRDRIVLLDLLASPRYINAQGLAIQLLSELPFSDLSPDDAQALLRGLEATRSSNDETLRAHSVGLTRRLPPSEAREKALSRWQDDSSDRVQRALRDAP